jgi:hypothetical protein
MAKPIPLAPPVIRAWRPASGAGRERSVWCCSDIVAMAIYFKYKIIFVAGASENNR